MERKGKISVVVVACVLFAGLCSTAPAKVVYVEDDATGAADGTSWSDAFAYLQDALLAAGRGDEIRVAQGVYKPDQGRVTTQPPRRGSVSAGALSVQANVSDGQGHAFVLKNGVAILGGFAGLGAEDPNARDPSRYQTILSGDLRGNDDYPWASGTGIYEFLRQDNSINVVRSDATDETAVLDGFIIESAVDSSMYCRDSSLQVANCVFRQGFTQTRGGGAFRCESGEPSFLNCTFEGNSNWSNWHIKGGALYALDARLTLVDCRFVGNWTDAGGGAISAVSSDLVVTGCTFERNVAGEGGAIYQTTGSLTMTECTFEGNAAGEGGAVVVAAEAVVIERCLFRGNWAVYSGGAIDTVVPTSIQRCTFIANSAPYGGAICASTLSGQHTDAEATEVTHCLFTGNRANAAGGALYSDRTPLAIHHCTFAGNWANRGSTVGWWSNESDPIALDNCIAWDGEDAILSSSTPRVRGISLQADNVVITYSDVQGGWPGEGNLDADPCFATPGYWADPANPGTAVQPDVANAVWVEGDYHLRSLAGRWDPALEGWVQDEVTSACIDAGDPAAQVGDEPEPNGGRVNMGAYGATGEASKSLASWPMIAVVEPRNGAVFVASGEPILIRAVAYDPDRAIVKVQFHIKGNCPGGTSSESYTAIERAHGWSIEWAYDQRRGVHWGPEGQYTVWAEAFGAPLSAVALSPEIEITITAN